MATGENEAEAQVEEGGPGAAYISHVLMEDLLDKLKLLNYDKEFLRKKASYKALSRHYFAITTNPGEQFFLFANLAAWLAQKAGNSKFDMPQEHDDPNATISNILDELRKHEITVDFPPNKLKGGSGEQCIFALDHLADAALKHSGFSWNRASPVADDVEDEGGGVEESEITAEQFDEDPAAADDDDDDSGFLDLNAMSAITRPTIDEEQKKEILQSETDVNEWKLEVERVMPSLKITIRPDAKDWRGHLEQMQQYRNQIVETMAQSKGPIEKLGQDIGRSLEKIQSREKYLNQSLESMLSQFRSAQDRYAEIREKYKEASGGVTERSKILAQVTEELEQVKQDMEQRGVGLTDGAPLVKIKQAITRLQQELSGVDVQVGVLDQMMLESQMRERAHLQRDMNVGLHSHELGLAL